MVKYHLIEVSSKEYHFLSRRIKNFTLTQKVISQLTSIKVKEWKVQK